jgi:triosephosphate isomerase
MEVQPMARLPIVAGNWKLHKTIDESVAFVGELLQHIEQYNGVERVVCPTFVSLAAVAQAAAGTPLKVGAQNVSEQSKGAYTGQIAAGMLTGLAEYVIIGHSEVRQYQGDTDALVNAKAKAALAAGLKPIIAVGESRETREAGDAFAFVSRQVEAALAGLSADDMAHVVIAYEPIWAIGTGLSATQQDAQEMIGGTIRPLIRTLMGDAVADAVRIQYGGSVKPNNMADYMAQPDIDGALVGGASLVAADFAALVKAAAEART